MAKKLKTLKKHLTNQTSNKSCLLLHAVARKAAVARTAAIVQISVHNGYKQQNLTV